MTVSPPKWLTPLFAAASLFLGAAGIRADISQAVPEFGDLERWAAFSLGGGITDTDTIDNFAGTTDIYGDVGVAGDGNITLSGSATIHGDLYYELQVTRLDEEASQGYLIRVPQHAVAQQPQIGDRLNLTFLMGQVTSAARLP